MSLELLKLKDEIGDYQKEYENFDFNGKRPGENIVLFLRRHWITLFFSFLPLVFAGIFILVIMFLSTQKQYAFFIIGDENLYYMMMTFILMFLWIIGFVVWIDYYLDVWIATDQRIIDMEQFGLFRREVSELELGKIQDVTTEILGVIPTFFNYGNVYVQTAGEKSRFTFKEVPNPPSVRNVIMRLQKEVNKRAFQEESAIFKGKM